MSWLFGNNEFNEHIEKATSEMIPMGQEDISLFLEICDRIRSKEVGAKEAMRSLKKRLLHKNPNVQLLALKLTDVCVKNGGPLFLAEVASREFMDTLVQLVNQSGTNVEVKNKILGHIQQWANAFKAKPNLSYAVDTFNSLKAQGHTFPYVSEKTDAIMIDTQTAPEWTDSDVCERCRTLFTLTNRKHHCRNCGKTYCNQCSRQTTSLPHFGINNEVRVCDGCFQKVTGAPGLGNLPTPTAESRSTSLPASGGATKEEEDLQRAIALSLLEAEKKSSSSNLSQQQPKQKKKQVTSDEEESDPELAAAIAASLKEVKLKDKSHKSKKSDKAAAEEESSGYYGNAYAASSSSSAATSATTTTSTTATSAPSGPVKSTSTQPTASDVQNIQMFHQLMDKMDADPTGASSAGILQDRELKLLHEQMTQQLHPKIVKEIEECVERHKTLMDLHEKLSSAVRVYDRLVEERLVQQQQLQQQQQQQQQMAMYAQYPYGPATGGYVQPQTAQSQQAYVHPGHGYYQQPPVPGAGGAGYAAPPPVAAGYPGAAAAAPYGGYVASSSPAGSYHTSTPPPGGAGTPPIQPIPQQHQQQPYYQPHQQQQQPQYPGPPQQQQQPPQKPPSPQKPLIEF